MDISYYLENGLLERYALGKLNIYQTAHIERMLEESLELGEALEKIYYRLEQQKNQDNEGV